MNDIVNVKGLRVTARNDMGEPCMATPAIADHTLFVRTQGHLYGIANGSEAKPRSE